LEERKSKTQHSTDRNGVKYRIMTPDKKNTYSVGVFWSFKVKYEEDDDEQSKKMLTILDKFSKASKSNKKMSHVFGDNIISNVEYSKQTLSEKKYTKMTCEIVASLQRKRHFDHISEDIATYADKCVSDMTDSLISEGFSIVKPRCRKPQQTL